MSEDTPKYAATPGFSVTHQPADLKTPSPETNQTHTVAALHELCVDLEIKILDERVYEHYPSGFAHATPDSTAFDLRSLYQYAVTLHPGDVFTFPTGLAVWIKHRRFCGFVLPRSGLGTNHRIVLANTVGLIDPDYQGELLVALENRHPKEPYTIEPGERIAQYFLLEAPRFHFQPVESFSSDTDRGSGAHGSTGRF